MIIFKYTIWYYLKAPFDILKIWLRFLKFFYLYFFGAPNLIKTLFKPWKRDISSYSEEKISFQSISYNLISRSIGFAVRLSIILFTIVMEVFLLVSGVLFLIFWLVWPFLLVYSLIFSISPLLAICVVSGFISLWFYKNTKEKSADKMNLKEIFKQKWSKNIWERLGINPKKTPEEILRNPKENIMPFLKQVNIKKENFKTALFWEISKQKKGYLKKRWWRKERLFSVKSPFKDLAYGYTPLIDQYSETTNALGNYEDLIDRKSVV